MSIQLGYNNVASGSGTTLIAGADIPANSLVQLGPDGRAYPAQVSDYAVTGQRNTTILSTTDFQYNPAPNPPYCGSLVAIGEDGSIFYLVGLSSSSMRLIKMTAAGGGYQYCSVSVSPSIISLSQPNLLIDGSGNPVICAGDNMNYGAYYIAFSKYRPSQTRYGMANATYDPYQFLVAVPVPNDSIASLFVSRSGNQLYLVKWKLDATTEWETSVTTVTPSTTNPPYSALVRQSDGTFVVAYSSSGNYNLAIYTSSGTVQKAAFSAGVSQFSNTASGGINPPPLLSAMDSGYFALAAQSSANDITIAMFAQDGTSENNIGLSCFGTNNLSAWYSIQNDGSNFWLFYELNSTTITAYKLIPGQSFPQDVAAAFSFNFPTPTAGISYWGGCQYDSAAGIFVILVGSNWITFSPSLGRFISTGTLPGSLTNTNQIAVSDGVMIVPATDTSNVNNPPCLSITKVADTAILGASQSGATIGDPVFIKTASGSQPINPLKGSVIKSFDHTSGNIYGNKGSIAGSAVSLKGI